ncbi:MAG: dihydrofolate reductase family protein [Actinomycetota bacterium]
MVASRKLVDYMFISLDGFIADPEGRLDWMPEDGDLMAYANEYFATCEGIVFGRSNYLTFVEYWDGMDHADPSVPAYEKEFSRIFRDLTRVVVSATLKEVDDPKAVLINGDVPGAIEELKGQPGGDLLLICGPDLRMTLIRAGLVDLYRMLIVPVVLGAGVRMFGDLDQPLRLRLLGTNPFSNGIVLHDYEPAVAPK